VAIEIVDLRSRTGIEEVNSYEHERSAMVGAIRRHVFALKDTHVGGYVVGVAITIRGRSCEVSQCGKATEIGDTVQFHIQPLKPKIDWARGEDVDQRRDIYSSRDGNGVGISIGCGFEASLDAKCGNWCRVSEMLSEKLSYIQLGLRLAAGDRQSKHGA